MLSRHHRTLFVHIPKCGGQSVETLFLDDLGLSWEDRGQLLIRPNRDRRLGPPLLSHLLASDYVPCGHMTEEEFNTFYRFTVVRDPYARVISTYNYLPTHQSLDDFVLKWLPRQFALREEYRLHPRRYAGFYYFVRPQADFVCEGEGGALLVRDVFRLEDIAGAAQTVCRTVGLSSALRHINRSGKILGTRDDLTGDHIALINRLYAADFDLFGYPRL